MITSEDLQQWEYDFEESPFMDGALDATPQELVEFFTSRGMKEEILWEVGLGDEPADYIDRSRENPTKRYTAALEVLAEMYNQYGVTKEQMYDM